MKRILNSKIDSLREEIFQSDGEITKETYEEIDRLHKLHLILGLKTKRTFWDFWFFPLLVIVTCLIVGYLVFSPVDNQAIVLKVKVSRISFTFNDNNRPMDNVNSLNLESKLEIDGILELDDLEIVKIYEKDKEPRQYKINKIKLDIDSGGVLAVNFPIQRGSKITLSHLGYGLYIINVDNSIVKPSTTRPKKDSIAFYVQKGSFNLDTKSKSISDYLEAGQIIAYNKHSTSIVFTNYKSNEIFRVAKVKDLNIGHEQSFSESEYERGIVDESVVDSGSVKFQSLNNQTYEFEPGEYFRLRNGNGTIRNLSLDNSGIHVYFVGNTQEIEAVNRQNPISLMPSKLEWVRENKSLQFLFGTIITIVGLFFAVARWFTRAQ